MIDALSEAMSDRFILPFDGPLDLATTLASGQCFRWRGGQMQCTENERGK